MNVFKLGTSNVNTALKLISTMGNCRSQSYSEAPGRLSSTLSERPIICGRGIQRKRWTEQLSIGNGKFMELKLTNGALNDLAVKLKELFSALTIEQHAYTTPWIERGVLKRLNDWESRYRTPWMERGPRPGNAWVKAQLN